MIADAGQLALFVRCHHWLVALPASTVSHLALLGEPGWILEPGSPGLGRLHHPAGRCRVDDLGLLLEMDATSDSWMLVRLDDGSPWALRCGRCVCVRPLPRSLPLAPGGSRRQLGLRIFATASVDGLDPASASPVGLALDLPRLHRAMAGPQ